MFRRSHRPRYRLLEQKLRRNTSMGIFKNRQRRRLVIQQLEPRRVPTTRYLSIRRFTFN